MPEVFTRYSLQMPALLMQKLAYISKIGYRTKAQVVVRSVEQYVAQFEREHGPIGSNFKQK